MTGWFGRAAVTNNARTSFFEEMNLKSRVILLPVYLMKTILAVALAVLLAVCARASKPDNKEWR